MSVPHATRAAMCAMPRREQCLVCGRQPISTRSLHAALRRRVAFRCRRLRRRGSGGGLCRVRLGRRLRSGFRCFILAGEIALLVAVLFEIGFVPAASAQTERRCGKTARDALGTTMRARGRIGVAELLQAVETVAAGSTFGIRRWASVFRRFDDDETAKPARLAQRRSIGSIGRLSRGRGLAKQPSLRSKGYLTLPQRNINFNPIVTNTCVEIPLAREVMP